MSRLYRAVEKAEREGLLTWTRPDHDDGSAHPFADDERLLPDDPFLLEGSAIEEVRPRIDSPEHHFQLDPLFVAVTAPGSSDDDKRFLADDAFLPEGPAIEEVRPRTDSPEHHSQLDPLLVAVTAPGSSAAEQFRHLRTRIESAEHGRRAQILLVTSPRIGEGKTTTSANLALTMAQEFQQRIVLVEADLRCPTLASLFGVPSEPGLADVLVGAATLEEAVATVPANQMWVLPAGSATARSTELLASSTMQGVIASLRSQFTRVVIDTPPMAVADTRVLARLADGVLVVVRAGVTPRSALARALAGVDRERLMGLVLNEVDGTSDEYAYARRASGE